MKVRNLFFTVAALSAICTQAATFECGGLYYTTTSANSVAVARVPAEMATNNPYKGVYIIPEQVYYDGANYQVTAIADSAFFQSKATEVQVPNTVTTIGECAFAYATDLANITLPLHLKDVSKMLLAGTNVVNGARSSLVQCSTPCFCHLPPRESTLTATTTATTFSKSTVPLPPLPKPVDGLSLSASVALT